MKYFIDHDRKWYIQAIQTMEYPVNPEWFIHAMEIIFGHLGEGQDTLYRAIIPMVNDYYAMGCSGKPCNIPDTADEIREDFHNRNGEYPHEQVLTILQCTYEWCRDAYEQGQKEANHEAIRDKT